MNSKRRLLTTADKILNLCGVEDGEVNCFGFPTPLRVCLAPILNHISYCLAITIFSMTYEEVNTSWEKFG